ncbi:MAG: hypothetical protein NTW86_19400, partial [Candidatus Sumerlaeota bacterium]|nr:hypothetical protein [Candidatus Sumerlaeota bacterium]
MSVQGSKAVRAIHRAVLHTALALGSLVFSLPFLWLLSTAAKQDAEIFVYPPELVPQIPGAVASSPWVDPDAYRPPSRPEEMSLAAWLNRRSEILRALREKAGAWLGDSPLVDLHSQAAADEAADGVWEKAALRLAPEDWGREPARIAETLIAAVQPLARDEILDTIQRRLVFGEARFDGWSMKETPVLNGADAATSWRILPAEGSSATIEPYVDSGKTSGLVRYRMAPNRPIVFQTDLALPFPADDFKRVVFSYRGDASWNALFCTVEFNGRRYRSHRPCYLAKGMWQQTRFQFASWEDTTRAQRPWFILEEEKAGGAVFNEPDEVRVEIALARQSDLRRIYGKLTENYRAALDYMPFWRYVRTSVILVTLNIFAELLGASLVAFAFARLRWPGRDLCFVLVLSTLMVPAQVVMIPRFLIWRWLGWYNTWAPLWFPALFGGAFFIFLLTQFMKTIPNDLE